MKHTHVKLTYFQQSGKYYSEGELEMPYVQTLKENVVGDRKPALVPGTDRPVMFHECVSAVINLLNKGERPDLVDGMDFDVLVTVYTEYGPLSHLLVRDEDGYVGQASKRVQRS